MRQPARASLGIAGVAAVGALLFDMLLLSRGLVVSLRQMLDAAGFDVRVMASEVRLPGSRPLAEATALATATAALPEVDAVVIVRFDEAQVEGAGGRRAQLNLLGATLATRRPWTLLEGRDLAGAAGDDRPAILINRTLARELTVSPGADLTVHGRCAAGRLPPEPVTFRVAGIAAFPFEDGDQLAAAVVLHQFRRVCGETDRDEADLLLVASSEHFGPDAAVRAVRRRHPDARAFTNEEVVARFRDVDFSYFRQISAVLASITLFFGFLLITVLLTVAVNQRLGEIAALRALGFTRRRVVSDVFCESFLMVGGGGLLALPLGLVLSGWLDGILRAMPGIPADLHFFVFEGRALLVYIGLLTATAVLAAIYPIRLVARLPIAATLRAEVVS